MERSSSIWIIGFRIKAFFQKGALRAGGTQCPAGPGEEKWDVGPLRAIVGKRIALQSVSVQRPGKIPVWAKANAMR